MKLGRFLPAALLGIASVAAHAQIGAYFNPIVTRVGNSQADNGNFSYLGANSTSGLRGGVSIGGYYMFGSGGPLKLGVDVRDEWQRGSNSLLNDFLLGLRVSGTVGRLMPYAEVLGGAGTTRAPFTQVHTTKGLAKGYVGADYRVNRRLDFRIVEVGFGALTTASSAQYNSNLSYPSSSLLSVSSGLVVRFR